MDSKKIETIIKLVKQNEVLWNLNKKGYKDIKAKARIWKTISKECGYEVEVVKKKWKRLRDSFFRELDKRETRSGETAQDPEEGWEYFRHLQFLKNYSRKRKLTTNHSNNEEANEYSDGNFVIEDPEPSNSMRNPTVVLREKSTNAIDGDDYLINEESDAITASDCGSAKKRVRNTSRSEGLIEVELVKTMISLQQCMKNKESVDEDDLFCQFMAAKLKKFPTITKNRVKLHIMTYLCNEEEKLLNN